MNALFFLRTTVSARTFFALTFHYSYFFFLPLFLCHFTRCSRRFLLCLELALLPNCLYSPTELLMARLGGRANSCSLPWHGNTFFQTSPSHNRIQCACSPPRLALFPVPVLVLLFLLFRLFGSLFLLLPDTELSLDKRFPACLRFASAAALGPFSLSH